MVISDHNVGNDFLLAHELGHALSLIHPWSPSSGGLWAGDHDSVLEPSGSPVIANPDENTYWNCIHATNPVITTLTGTCCLTHDVPDHYVRDFPEHTGAEAPVPPPGRNFYAMSNLWNRRSNTAGGVTPDGQPEHQRPARFNSDGTPYQNYLFAKVETVVNLPVHDVQVKFFLKHPGSGGGAANFRLLGAVAVPDTLRPSSPQTVSLPWQVPAGTPQHSCTFAVARSPAEPDDDLTSLNFQEVEALVHTKNAWVQRNLDISDYPSAENNNGEPNTVWAAPIVISLPREEGLKALPVVLEVDAEGAKRLLGLAVEVPGKERYEVEPGSRAKFELKSRVKPGQELPLIVSAIIPGDAEVGETFSVHIDPRLGRIPLAGYGFEMRITKPYEFVGQILDIALATYRDYAEITGSEVADKLARLHRDALAQEWYSPRRFQDWLADYVDLVKMLVDEMTRFELFDTLAVGEAFDRFAQAMSNPKGIAPLSCYRDLVSRLQMVVRSLYMK